ncbi:GNAT family N-acetyltransferase [Mycolicibacterium sp. CR10]|uniref:GNAT family N-acetyltransferase n=1 Tax=Mycolicibacterium sp. CR10 TaxID=2562314 RepID=UPI00148590FE|nr:GNAT family N-acetyltransferase [Mycolicibacterium sp. CR10]
MNATLPASPTVVLADPRHDPRWRQLVSGSSGSLFTSPPWISSICDTYGFTPQARIVVDTSGRPTDGFAWVPISDIRGDRLVSLPFSDRAEPVVSDATAWRSLVGDAMSGDTPLSIRCLDDSEPATDVRFIPTGQAAWHCTPLGLPPAELYRSLSSAARRNIATAGRNQVVVKAIDGIEGVRIYHRLHVRLRKYKYRLLAQPLTLFERIWEEFSAHDGIVTFIAYADEEPVAGSVYLAWNDTLYYKFGASLASALSMRPNDAVAWTALRWASERRFRYLDWGLSDLDQPGLVAYKRKWASDERRIVTLCSMSPKPRSGHDTGRVLGELTRLLTDDAVPDAITERAGSILYRYFA